MLLKKMNKMFWNRKKKQTNRPIEPIQEWYEIIPIVGGNLPRGSYGVKISKGPYKDLVIKFGAVSVDGKTDNRTNLRYEYDFVFVPTELEGKELSDEEETTFHNFLGDVLANIMEAAVLNESKDVTIQPEEK